MRVYLSSYWSKSHTPVGQSKEHGFTKSFSKLTIAAEMYIASDYRHMPTEEEINRIDRDWMREVSEVTALIMQSKPTAGETGEDGA